MRAIATLAPLIDVLNGTDTNLEQVNAREHYGKLRETLVAL